MVKNIIIGILVTGIIFCFIFPTNVNKAVQLEKKEDELQKEEQFFLEWSNSINDRNGRAEDYLDSIEMSIEAMNAEWKKGKLVNIQGCEDFSRLSLVLKSESGEIVNLVVDREELEEYTRCHISVQHPEDFIGQDFWYSLEDGWILSGKKMSHYGLKKIITEQELQDLERSIENE